MFLVLGLYRSILYAIPTCKHDLKVTFSLEGRGEGAGGEMVSKFYDYKTPNFHLKNYIIMCLYLLICELYILYFYVSE